MSYESQKFWDIHGLTKLWNLVGPLTKDLTRVGGSELGSYESRSELDVELGSYEFK